MLLTEEQAKKVFAESYESKISALACAASENGWSLVSTNEQHIHAIVDGALMRCDYQSGSEGVDFGKPSPVVTLPESDAVGLVAGRIKSLATKITAGEPIDSKDILVSLSRHAKGFMTNSQAVEGVKATPMNTYYEENKAEVRRGLYGRLGELESELRLTHYRHMSAARANENRQEILDSLKGCEEALDSLECQAGGKVNELLSEFKTEAQRASAILRHSGLTGSELAAATDYFSKSIQTATILRDYMNQEGN